MKVVLANKQTDGLQPQGVAVAFRSIDQVELHTLLLRLAYANLAKGYVSRAETIRNRGEIYSQLEQEYAQMVMKRFTIFVASVLGHELGHMLYGSTRRVLESDSDEGRECDTFSRELCIRTFGGFSLEFRDKLTEKAKSEGSWEVLAFSSREEFEQTVRAIADKN